MQNQASRNHDVIPLSAATGEGCDVLLAIFDRRVEGALMTVPLDVSVSDGSAIAWLYALGEVVSRRDDESHAHLTVRLSEADLGRFKSRAIVH